MDQVPDLSTQPPAQEASPMGKVFWVKFAVSLLLLMAVAGLLAYFFKDPLTQASKWFMDQFGMWGMVGGIFFTDTWILPPLTHEPLLFFAHASGKSFVHILMVAGTASTVAGVIGYGLGMVAGNSKRVQQFLTKSGVEHLLSKRPFTIVALAAITPLPFAPTTWTAGALRIPFVPFLGGCFARFVKVALYLWLIVQGWSLAS